MDYEKKYNEAIEIPFGAHDSELKGWEYTIPEGYTAEIKDGKIIVKEKEPMEIRYAGKVYKVHDIREFPCGRHGYIIEDEPGHYDCILNPDEVLGGGYVIKGCGSPYPTKDIAFNEHPAEWSEEDEKMRLACIDTIEHFLIPSGSVVYGPWDDCVSWLKSLRPQPHWKPSEEQMTVLEIACKYEGVFTQGQLSVLFDLKEQLKKL